MNGGYGTGARSSLTRHTAKFLESRAPGLLTTSTVGRGQHSVDLMCSCEFVNKCPLLFLFNKKVVSAVFLIKTS